MVFVYLLLQIVELPELEELQLNVPIIPREDLDFRNTLLGEGGQATVEKGEWKTAALTVAIKSFYRSQVKDKLTLREIALLDKVRHPNIVSILGVSRTPYSYHIVLELFGGVSLGDVLFGAVTSYQLSMKEKASILQQLSTAVMFLHETLKPSILHRDIKPHNILIQKRSKRGYLETKLCDFGMAKSEGIVTSLRLTDRGVIRGTKWYLAPEILIDRLEPTTPSDIWALGVTVVEMYTKKDFWPYLDLEYIMGRMKKNNIPPAPGIPEPLFCVIKQCLCKKPSSRPKISFIINKMKQHSMWVDD